MRCFALLAAAVLLTGCGESAGPAPAESQAKKADACALYAAQWAASSAGCSAPVQVLLAHDRIVNVCRYRLDAPRRHSAEGVFLDGAAVCDGYAAAFQSLLCAVQIPSVTVTGTRSGIPHAWNLVFLSGHWYHVDCTADDTDAGAPLHGAFLCADDAMREYNWARGDYPAADGTDYCYAQIVREIMQNAENPVSP